MVCTGSNSCGPCTNATGVPDPGTGDQVNVAWLNVEPNDTPQQATPLGISQIAQVNPWVVGNQIGGTENSANYFVFQSAPTLGEFESNMCFSFPITGMTASLWMVIGGVQQCAPIGTWTVSNSCQVSYSAPLEPSTVYLFGVFATGTADGGVGTYTA
jgi:hypothetical protein